MRSLFIMMIYVTKGKRYSTASVGWQSWSPVHAAVLKFPVRNYSPFGDIQAFPSRSVKLPTRHTSALTGWCSWYAYGSNISEEKILAHVGFIIQHHIPLSTILIDDGWAPWGDWKIPYKNKFSDGMRALAQKITNFGLKPGLWIAPFLCNPDAELVTKHPSWFIRTPDSAYVDGRKISPFDRMLPYKKWILDMTKPEAQSYIFRVIDTIISDWGYTFLKLDFLYAQHFNPKFTSPTIPDRLLHDFLITIKKRYPRVHIAACGCPLIPAIGACDSMRISEDIVNPQLRDIWTVNHIVHSQRLIQLRQNLLLLRFTNKWWILDPDVFVCDPAYGFSPAQIRTLQKTIIETKGLRFLGDNLLTLDAEKIEKEIIPFLST